jgi:putative ABC transport system permease protein
VALVLAVTGLCGVLAYVVTQRTREIGIRIALGAQRRDVLGLVLRHGAKLTLVGIAIGLAGALGLTRLLGRLLYDVKPTDPLTFAGVTLCLPRWRCSPAGCRRGARRVDPMEALRCE